MKDDKIPQIIHYCWFGKGKKTKLMIKCMKTWSKFFPDYKFIEWNEDNFNINSNKYVKEAYKNKKYAFVSDYVRLYALYNYGGIYLDTDIEIVKGFIDIIKDRDIYAFEKNDLIMTGVMIARKKSKIIEKFMKMYDNLKFVNDDGTFNLIPNTYRLTEILKEYGLICNNKKQTLENNIADIYPIEYFCAYDMDNSYFIPTENTYTIHHYDGSWTSNKQKIQKKLKRIISMVLGVKLYDKIRKLKNNRK